MPQLRANARPRAENLSRSSLATRPSRAIESLASRIEDLTVLLEGYGFDAPIVHAGRYTDHDNMRRRIPKSAKSWDRLEVRVIRDARRRDGALQRRITEDAERALQARKDKARSILSASLRRRREHFEGLSRLLQDQLETFAVRKNLGVYLSFTHSSEIALPVNVAMVRNLPHLLALQEDYTPDPAILESSVSAMEVMIKRAVRESTYRRLSMIVCMKSLFAVAQLRHNGSNNWFEWEEPFIGALERAREVTGANEIKKHAEYYAIDNSSTDPEIEGCFTTRTVTSSIIGANSTFRIVIDRDDPEDESLKNIISRLHEVLDEVIKVENPRYLGSRWIAISSVQIAMYQVGSERSQASSYIKLPKVLAAKKCLVNPKNLEDNRCFLYASLAHFAQAAELVHPERLSVLKKLESKISWPKEIKFPFNSADLAALELANPNITWNIFAAVIETESKSRVEELNEDNQNEDALSVHSLEDEESAQRTTQLNIMAMHSTTPEKYRERATLINILEYNGHYMYISNLDRLLSKTSQQCAHCPICTKRFMHDDYKKKRDTHTADCKQTWKSLFEPRSPGIIVPNELRIDFTDTGEECHVRLIEYLLNNINKIRRACAQFEKDTSNISPEQHMNYENRKKCHRCHLEFEPKNKKRSKVLEHCHSTGEYRGAAHANCCNKFSAASLIRKIPVYFHGGSKYDNQFIWQALAHPRIQRRIKGCKEKGYRSIEIGGIVLNGERFKTINIGPYQIIDSMSFIASGLERALSDLPVERKISLKFAADERAAKMNLDAGNMFKAFQNKQLFPYELAWFDELDKPIEPRIEGFQNRLRNAFGKTEEETEKRMKAANEKLQLGELKEDGSRGASLADQLEEFKQLTGANTWRDLHDIYLTIDVCGLTDCMRNFRQISLETFGLDPSYFISNSSFAWKAMLRHTKAKLELLKTSEMYRHYEDGLRSGLAMTRNRVFTCNNIEISKYDDQADTKHAMYLDANALYGSAMQNKLPEGKFRDIDPDTFDVHDPKYGGVPLYPGQSCEEWQSDIGAYVDCDITYPEHLHDLHSDYPLLPEPMIVQEYLLSESQRGKRATPCKKLVVHLLDRSNYKIHITALKLAVELGLEITKVHRVIEFAQSAWMRPWIELCTAKRKASTTDADSNYFKLMANACFGMTMQGVMHHTQATVVTNANSFAKALKNPRARTYYPMAPEMALIISDKNRYLLDKPVFVGQAILDISKVTMQTFWYRALKPTFPNKELRLIQHDTDSFIIGITTSPGHIGEEEFNSKILRIREKWMDMSTFNKEHRFYSEANKKTPGFFKDEMGSNIITEAVGLGAKTYSLQQKMAGTGTRKGKGAPERVVAASSRRRNPTRIRYRG